jgi:signal peptidase II
VSRKALLFTVITLVSLVSDQLSKWWVKENIHKSIERVDVIDGFFQLVHVENTGAAFGLLGDWPYAMYVFAVFTLVAIGVLISLYWEIPPEGRFMPAALAFILSGALGNAIDRVHKQAVTDFLRVYTDHPSVPTWLLETFGTAEYPSFNIADVSISIGVVMFIYAELFMRKKAAPEEPSELADEGAV